ncbi:TetR family transcriptional regulator [Mycolicibacterium goodii]|uniref:TetR family transcriptional regulator n=1 Tax=Mycolicibacterium goodii TaxID=134601 RepID=A0A0K0XA15_MYCGD|nr:TetR family transcriptional regulator [Mycolicibacterium goodii]
MSRWEPDARGRLERAALELYAERGFEQTTVAEIAERAGLTERTFFRYFADKREVLFGGEHVLQDLFVDAVAAAPADAGALEAVAAGLEAVGEMFVGRHPVARRRQAVVGANTALQERELIKLAALAAAVAAALRDRGVPQPAADLAGETGIAVFKVAFERWIGEDRETDLRMVLREVLDDLRALVAAG